MTSSASAMAASAAGVVWASAPGPIPTTESTPFLPLATSSIGGLLSGWKRNASHGEGHRSSGARLRVRLLGNELFLGAGGQQRGGSLLLPTQTYREPGAGRSMTLAVARVPFP